MKTHEMEGEEGVALMGNERPCFELDAGQEKRLDTRGTDDQTLTGEGGRVCPSFVFQHRVAFQHAREMDRHHREHNNITHIAHTQTHTRIHAH
jgi:hypothetical protein